VRAALYARISTNDGRQHAANQLDELIEFALAQHWHVFQSYVDEESGAVDERVALKRLLTDAQTRKFDVLLVWDLSRLTRGGPAKAFEYIERLKKCGVDFWSLKEPHFRTSGDGVGDVFIALAAHIAREERRVMRQRIMAGMARARKDGKAIGRPAAQLDPGRLLRYIEEGLSIRRIAELENSTPATVHRRLARLKAAK